MEAKFIGESAAAYEQLLADCLKNSPPTTLTLDQACKLARIEKPVFIGEHAKTYEELAVMEIMRILAL